MIETFELSDKLLTFGDLEPGRRVTWRIFPFIVPAENCSHRCFALIACLRFFEQLTEIGIRAIGRKAAMHKLFGIPEKLLGPALRIFHLSKERAIVATKSGFLSEG